jgi:hypothetical protein
LYSDNASKTENFKNVFNKPNLGQSQRLKKENLGSLTNPFGSGSGMPSNCRSGYSLDVFVAKEKHVVK